MAGPEASSSRPRRPLDNGGTDNDNGLSPNPNGRPAKRLRPSLEPDEANDIRRNDDDASDSDEDETANETYYSTTSGRRSNGVGTAPRSKTKPTFQPGAIVRVTLDNFVTYEHAEFDPGPSLNLVIGPNGTGKSSLVCAICLGLGFHSNVLGRATTFGDFVKHGRSHAVVEIELQAREDEIENHVVRLRINREDNSRKFWLNGQEAPLKRIQSLMAEMRIQVDNLCQFLPQDRVAEFAGLNSIDLLAKTLEAAAPLDMKAMQTSLRDIYHAQRDAEKQIQIDSEQLRILEGRHQTQQADVERYREREEIQKAIDDLEDCQPLVHYYEAKRKYRELKEERRRANRDLAALTSRLQPTLEAISSKEQYQEQLKAGLSVRTAVLQSAEQAVGQALANIERYEDEIQSANAQHLAMGESRDKKRKDIAATRQKITSLEARIKNKPPEFVASEWNMKIRDKEHQRREIEQERGEIASEMTRVKGEAFRLQTEKKTVENDMAALDSQRGQQISFLRRIAPDVARGWAWLEENKGQFSKEIFGPPMATCSIKDQNYSNLIQMLFQNDDFLCFTAQSIEDHKKLSNQFYGAMGLSVTIRTCTTPFSSFRSPFSPDQLASMGFEGTAIDFIEGPEPVLAMLCAERRLHLSPVSTQQPRPDQYDTVVANENIMTWASKDLVYRVNRRREYGAHAVSTAVRDVRPGRYWTTAQADVSEKTDLQRKLDQYNNEIRNLQEEMRGLKEKMAGPLRMSNEIDAEIERLRAEKNQLQSEYNKWLALPEKVLAENNTLNQLREEHADLSAQRQQLVATLDDLVQQKAKAVLRHAEHVARLHEAYLACMDVQVREIEAASDVAGLQAQNAHLTALRAEKQQALADIVANLAVQRDLGEAAIQEAHNIAHEGSERSLALHALAQTKTTESLQNEVAAERAKLELTRAVDEGVLDEYEQRASRIEQLRRALATTTADFEGMAAQVADVRGRWEPRLDDLIGRINDAFSYNFEQINCAGEISVHKDEDFDKWAIDIRVKFRENEELQKLDQHRQSGGERAVSTIFYLMSLQAMAQAPFRVVDEINQGMDPRNERMMHERMVEIACHEHTSQYFLITPKLLPNLKYDENMTVLCIASGPFVPDGEAKLDFRKCMATQRRLLAEAAA
ncbi:SMC5 protein [Sporothrix schenckii 1099-18]|uniref:Structural maintenance of chromosomes protein 5 n=1 Tax=Sporothrix schenckii 1099-18 TaxID=1397361 RepID=A0A0F2M784_SPOSC|nr:SMC5 protein [Sporothrix schenckii 1099-18]KJR85492.1 SMC5 protein [Sporothrix schenckii 1099-18]